MTEHEDSLTRSAAKGVAWSYLAVTIGFGLQLVYTAVMSRLLEPSDFGLMAAALLGLRFVTYLSRFGLGSAVVQREHLAKSDKHVAFTLSVGIAMATTLLALAVAPVLASLLAQSDAVDVMRWMAVGVFLASCAVVPEGLLRRHMRFRAVSLIQITSTAIGFLGVGIPLALHGWGVGSLVAASIAQSTVQLVAQLYLERSCAHLDFDRETARGLLTFGGLVAATGFLEFVSGSVDTFAVSRWNGAAPLGQYSRATLLVGLPIEQATTATSRVLLPSFAKVQSDEERFTRGVRSGIGLLALVVMVPAGLAIAAAPALVGVVLGTGWEEAARVLPALAPAYGVSMLIHVPAVAAEAKGLVGRKFLIQSVVLAVFVGLVGVAVAVGPTLLWFACAWSASEVVRLALYLVAVIPRLGVQRSVALARYTAAAVVAVLAAVPAWVIVRSVGMTGLVGLLLAGALGVLGALVGLALPSSRVLRQDIRVAVKR